MKTNLDQKEPGQGQIMNISKTCYGRLPVLKVFLNVFSRVAARGVCIHVTHLRKQIGHIHNF